MPEPLRFGVGRAVRRLAPFILLAVLAMGGRAASPAADKIIREEAFGEADDFGPTARRAVVSSALFLLVFSGAGWWIVSRSGLRRRSPASGAVRELGTWTLSGGTRLYAVRFLDKVILLGSWGTGVATLGEVPADAWPRDENGAAPRPTEEMLRRAAAWVSRWRTGA